MRAIKDRLRSPVAIIALVVFLVVAAVLVRPFARDIWRRHQLVQSLDGRDPVRRLGAAIGLGKLHDARAVPVLIDVLAAPDDIAARPEDSVAALCAVGGSAVPAIEMALNRSLADPSRLAEALVCIDDPRAQAALKKFLVHADVARLGPVVSTLSSAREPRITALLADAAGRVDRARQLRIVASLSDARGRPVAPRLATLLTDMARDPDPEMRAAAIGTTRWNELNAPRSAGDWTTASPDAAAVDLASAADRARAFLAARQDGAGFWRTAMTATPAFVRAYRERNTYLTPMIVDMLAPAADDAKLHDILARARQQIATQIEGNGLVRYYGVTESADDPKRGCVISYDADDTALAWRVAPLPDQAKLRSALATLRQFRAPDGLFHTWLAPPGALQCVNRGSNPNPPDVGIQMHILMLLAKTSPPDARALCSSLRQAINDERIWVYYRREPLVPMIRRSDLDRAGCPLTLPDRHLRTEFGGQGMWLAVARALTQPSRGTERDATLMLLRGLARDDFLAIRRSPPLLYQNDASASIPAFYWSQEYGVALWLRLYFETMRGNR